MRGPKQIVPIGINGGVAPSGVLELLKIGFSLPNFKNPFILPYPSYAHDLPCMLLYMPRVLMLCYCRVCELLHGCNYCLWANGLLMALYCGLIAFLPWYCRGLTALGV